MESKELKIPRLRIDEPILKFDKYLPGFSKREMITIEDLEKCIEVVPRKNAPGLRNFTNEEKKAVCRMYKKIICNSLMERVKNDKIN